jgi:hypothetical protein
MKVLIALETNCLPKYAEQRLLCETTWGSRMPPGYTFESFDGPRLGVGDDYNSLCEKTRAICGYAAIHEYESLIVVDDDTYIRTDRLEVPACDYGGHCLPKVPDGSLTYCAGFFYWLTRRAFTILAEAPLQPQRWKSAEDQWVGWTLREHGIEPTGLPEAVLQPCRCGRCTPAVITGEWTAYSIWPKFSPELFNGFEKRYSANL